MNFDCSCGSGVERFLGKEEVGGSIPLRSFWRGDRVAEGDGLENHCTFFAYRGFESPSLRFL